MSDAMETTSPLKMLLNSPVQKSLPCSSMPPPSIPLLSKNNIPPQSMINVITPISATSGDPVSSIHLQNCVVTANLCCELDLMKIYVRTRNSEFNPSRFKGVVMRIREPRSTALIFRSGKLVCTGSRNEPDALLAVKKFSRIIQKIGFPVKLQDFKIHNMVATCDLRFPIKLENLHQVHGQFSSYEPELFQGLIYRMVKPRVVLLIFVNGKIIFTAGKTRQDIQDALENIYPILKSFRKN